MPDDRHANRNQTKTAHKEEYALVRLKRRLMHDARTPKFWLEILALIGLAFYTVAAYQQRNAMITSNDINRKGLASVQRAYMSLTNRWWKAAYQ